MYTEDYKHNGIFLRRLLLKLLLIFSIIILLIWILPKFISYKPSNKNNNIKVKEESTDNKLFAENLTKLKDAALVYYKEDKLPLNSGDIQIVTLKELIKENLITNLYNSNKKKCDVKKSYAKITKLTDDYLLKIFISCDSKTDYLLVHVGKYDYCRNYICEKDTTKELLKEEDNNKEDKILDSKQTEKNTINDSKINISDEVNIEAEPDSKKENTKPNKSSNNKLSAFTSWSEYTRTSCNTANITCDINDFNCLKEIRTKKQIEQVGTYNKKYTTYSLSLKLNKVTRTKACKNYNYVTIQGITYKTTGNYEELFNLNGKNSTSSWTYKETITTKEIPSFGGNTYYRFVGADYSNCTNTCSEAPSYYYDVYIYTHPMIKVNNLIEGCDSIEYKDINSYTVAKKQEIALREEPLYANACYESTRTRNIIK